MENNTRSETADGMLAVDVEEISDTEPNLDWWDSRLPNVYGTDKPSRKRKRSQQEHQVEDLKIVQTDFERSDGQTMDPMFANGAESDTAVDQVHVDADTVHQTTDPGYGSSGQSINYLNTAMQTNNNADVPHFGYLGSEELRDLLDQYQLANTWTEQQTTPMVSDAIRTSSDTTPQDSQSLFLPPSLDEFELTEDTRGYSASLFVSPTPNQHNQLQQFDHSFHTIMGDADAMRGISYGPEHQEERTEQHDAEHAALQETEVHLDTGVMNTIEVREKNGNRNSDDSYEPSEDMDGPNQSDDDLNGARFISRISTSEDRGRDHEPIAVPDQSSRHISPLPRELLDESRAPSQPTYPGRNVFPRYQTADPVYARILGGAPRRYRPVDRTPASGLDQQNDTDYNTIIRRFEPQSSNSTRRQQCQSSAAGHEPAGALASTPSTYTGYVDEPIEGLVLTLGVNKSSHEPTFWTETLPTAPVGSIFKAALDNDYNMLRSHIFMLPDRFILWEDTPKKLGLRNGDCFEMRPLPVEWLPTMQTSSTADSVPVVPAAPVTATTPLQPGFSPQAHADPSTSVLSRRPSDETVLQSVRSGVSNILAEDTEPDATGDADFDYYE